MKPFNLEEAKKKGVKSLVYRNGERPLEVFFSEKAINPIITVGSDRLSSCHNIKGKACGLTEDNNWDLFMLEEEMWVNVYERINGSITCSDPHESKERAEKEVSFGGNCNYIGTYKLIKE